MKLRNIKAKLNKAIYYGQKRHKFKAWGSVAVLSLILIAVAYMGYYRGSYYKVENAYAEMTTESAVKDQALDQVFSEVVQKDQQIAQLEERFNELMKNPITFKQTYFLETEILPRTRTHGIPDALAASQWALESNRQVHRPGHNYWGIMQWDQNRVRSLRTFSTLDDAVKMYADTIKSILKRKGYTFDPNEDPKTIAFKLQEGTPRYEGDNEDPMIYANHISSLKEFSYYKK